ncbi:MAG: O-antigen ligase family protein [Blautia sp.]|nr:O-antigen ligase family protein [Blautia sp.]
MLIPIILALGFVPLLVHQYEYHTHLSVFDWFPNASEVCNDFFLAYKSFAIMLLGAVMLLVLAYCYRKRKKLSFEPMLYLLFSYAALVFMSGLFSRYRAYAFRGGYEMFESVWVVLAYVMFCYYTCHCVQKEGQVFTVLNWSGIGVLLVTLIGVFQYFGRDFFKTTIGKKLILNPSAWDKLDTVSFHFGERTVYTTLYNVDFLSFFYGIFIPVLITMFFAAKKWWQKLLYLLAFIMFAVCLVGSGASSAYPAFFGAAVVCFYILLSRKGKKPFWVGFAVGAAVLIAAIAALFVTPKGIALRARYFGTSHWAESFFLKDIDTLDESVVFTLPDKKLEVSYQMDAEVGGIVIAARDESGNLLSYTMTEDGTYTCVLDDTSYGNCSMQPVNFGDYYGIGVTIDGRTWYFTNQIDGTYYYVNPMGKYVKMQDVPSAELFYDEAFSGRGPIWNRTIPLFKRYLIFGAGAGNYMLAYPQNDYIFRVYRWGVGTYDVKAHCWPMQQWVENGLPALLCLIGFYLWYFIQSVKIYRRADLKQGITLVGFGILLGTVTYVIVSFFNDSNVNTAPAFWILLGLGMAVNRIVTKEQKITFQEAEEAAEEKQAEEKPAPVPEKRVEQTAKSGTDKGTMVNTPKKSKKKKRGKR